MLMMDAFWARRSSRVAATRLLGSSVRGWRAWNGQVAIFWNVGVLFSHVVLHAESPFRRIIFLPATEERCAVVRCIEGQSGD